MKCNVQSFFKRHFQRTKLIRYEITSKVSCSWLTKLLDNYRVKLLFFRVFGYGDLSQSSADWLDYGDILFHPLLRSTSSLTHPLGENIIMIIRILDMGMVLVEWTVTGAIEAQWNTELWLEYARREVELFC